jgi:hypothetical protein
VNIHLPELWGVLQFGGVLRPVDDQAERWALRRVYYAERAHHARTGAYSADLDALGLGDLRDRVGLALDGGGYLARIGTDRGDSLRIDRDGKVSLDSRPAMHD